MSLRSSRVPESPWIVWNRAKSWLIVGQPWEIVVRCSILVSETWVKRCPSSTFVPCSWYYRSISVQVVLYRSISWCSRDKSAFKLYRINWHSWCRLTMIVDIRRKIKFGALYSRLVPTKPSTVNRGPFVGSRGHDRDSVIRHWHDIWRVLTTNTHNIKPIITTAHIR